MSAQAVSSTSPGKNAVTLEGEICNTSEGGCCILSQQPCPVSTLLECRVSTANIPYGIPTLVQVRWSRPHAARGFALGVAFLIG